MFYIFDLDGTLVQPNAPGIKVPRTYREQEIRPGVREACQTLRAQGHTLAIATNQGGVAFGICTVEEVVGRLRDVQEELGINHWRFCTWHENGKLEPYAISFGAFSAYHKAFWRKPNPGMLFDLMLQLEFTVSQTTYVGDQESDRQAALNAGVGYIHIDDFLKWFDGEK